MMSGQICSRFATIPLTSEDQNFKYKVKNEGNWAAINLNRNFEPNQSDKGEMVYEDYEEGNNEDFA